MHRQLLETSSFKEWKRQGQCWHPLYVIETGYGMGEVPFAVVERTQDKGQSHRLSGGQPVILFSGNEDEKVRAAIHWIDKDRCKLFFLQNELPEELLKAGRVGIVADFDDNSFQQMESALKEVDKARNCRLAELRDLFYEKDLDPRFHERVPAPSDQLNDSQNEAVESILAAEDIAIVHGPPGTGKTTTLVEAIVRLSKREKQILVCAPSNAAVDLLVERIAARGVNTLRIGHLSRVTEGVVEHTLDGKAANHSDAKRIKQLKKEAQEYRDMAGKYKRNFGHSERQQRRMLQDEARRLRDDANVLEQHIVDDLLSNAKVICTTLIGANNRTLEGKTFSTVVIDEAAQGLEAACWIPIRKAERVVLAGDPYQLPPTVKSDEAARQGLTKTLIERGIEKFPDVSLLRVQYRMHEAIMGFSNQQFYEGQLEAHESVRGALLDIESNTPVEFVDTAGCGFDEEQPGSSPSRINPEEADLLFTHLRGLISEMANPHDLSLAIISPYKRQVELLRELIEEQAELKFLAASINTIDAFQGQERDVVYLSLVRSNDRGEIGFLGDTRRMNVAMTRAKRKLVIVGDSATIGSNTFYAALLDYCQDKGFYRSAWEWR